jgi:monoamine oxidase
VSVIEARNRFGGRILTAGNNDADCDLGPSWFWPGQPLVAGLLEHFRIPHYAQFADGDILLQRADGKIERSSSPSPMTGSRRIQGGINQLVDAIAAQIDNSHCFLDHMAIALSLDGDAIIVDANAPSGRTLMRAQHVALAIPPRLAAELQYTPELPLEVMALSQAGPLAEIHDASPGAENSFSLFGFSGLDSQSRETMGQAEFIRHATMQLATLFGDQANSPQAVYFQDWSSERFTASVADRRPPTRHPQYGLDLRMDSGWDGKLSFISSETSFRNGGLIEGALESGLGFAGRMTGSGAGAH